jgi:hypothetical protein
MSRTTTLPPYQFAVFCQYRHRGYRACIRIFGHCDYHHRVRLTHRYHDCVARLRNYDAVPRAKILRKFFYRFRRLRSGFLIHCFRRDFFPAHCGWRVNWGIDWRIVNGWGFGIGWGIGLVAAARGRRLRRCRWWWWGGYSDSNGI